MISETEAMKRAVGLAKKASLEGEVPVGAVLLRNGEILAEAYNRSEAEKDTTAHAEMLAIRAGFAASGKKHLEDCTLVVTMEPCVMCAGAIVGARVGKVVYGAKDYRCGAMGSLLNVSSYPLYFRPKIEGGVLREECADLLTSFFGKKREKS